MMHILLTIFTLCASAIASETFETIEAEVIGMSIVAIFLYVVVRLKTIMSKKCDS